MNRSFNRSLDRLIFKLWNFAFLLLTFYFFSIATNVFFPFGEDIPQLEVKYNTPCPGCPLNHQVR